MLKMIRQALFITSRAYDAQLKELISAALDDLGVAGIATRREDLPLIRRAVATYCRAHFGNPANYEALKRAYDEQKAQLQMASGYTDWGQDDAQV